MDLDPPTGTVAHGPGRGAGTARAPAVRVVPLGEERRDDVLDLDQWAFAFDDEGLDPEVGVDGLEWDRTRGAVAGDREGPPLLGICAAYTMRLPVPGGETPAAGLTWVAVHPQHRRRGVMRALLTDHLEGLHAAGREPVSVLWAAEPAIYGRFGYAAATLGVRLTMPRAAALRDVPGAAALHVTIERADADRHAEVVAGCWDRARADRPGMVSRDSAGLRRRPFVDLQRWRDGAERLRILTVRDSAGDVRGYALFRRRSRWEDAGPNGDVRVAEAVALDAAAARALWGRLVDLDLMSRTVVESVPVDDALLHLLVDLRRAAPGLGDNLWVRLVDVAPALAARRYLLDLDVVLDVEDPTCPWNTGRWRLRGGPEGATCEASRAAADLAVDVDALGAAYLGGTSLAALAAAGRVRERRPGALTAAAGAFGWPVQPWCGWLF